jgi:hypothetical protein
VGSRGQSGLGIAFLPGEVDTRGVLQTYVEARTATC